MASVELALACGALAGTALGAAAARGIAGRQDPLVRASLDRQGVVLRELVRLTVPAAVELATDRAGVLDPGRFQDLVIASIAAASDPSLDLGATGPAVWEVDGKDARSPEQEQLLQRLLTYPDPSEAPALLAALDGLGPQTVVQFATFAVNARTRLAVGLEGVMAGPTGAVLTGHLIAAGLVQEVDGPAPAEADPDTTGAFYALSAFGTEVARLFAPPTTRPQELAALDPAPAR